MTSQRVRQALVKVQLPCSQPQQQQQQHKTALLLFAHATSHPTCS